MSSRSDRSAWLLAGALALSAWFAFGRRRPATAPQPQPMLEAHGEGRPITASPAATGAVVALALACLVGAALYYPLVYNARADALAIRGTGGHADHAGPLFVRYGCAGCHTIPGVRLARGTYGPPLTGLADRARLGGTVENTPENLVRWISRAHDLDPHAGMPNTDASERDARDMAAYLYAR